MSIETAAAEAQQQLAVLDNANQAYYAFYAYWQNPAVHDFESLTTALSEDQSITGKVRIRAVFEEAFQDLQPHDAKPFLKALLLTADPSWAAYLEPTNLEATYDGAQQQQTGYEYESQEYQAEQAAATQPTAEMVWDEQTRLFWDSQRGVFWDEQKTSYSDGQSWFNMDGTPYVAPPAPQPEAPPVPPPAPPPVPQAQAPQPEAPPVAPPVPQQQAQPEQPSAEEESKADEEQEQAQEQQAPVPPPAPPAPVGETAATDSVGTSESEQLEQEVTEQLEGLVQELDMREILADVDTQGLTAEELAEVFQSVLREEMAQESQQ